MALCENLLVLEPGLENRAEHPTGTDAYSIVDRDAS